MSSTGDEDGRDEFGYGAPHYVSEPIGWQVAEGKSDDALLPRGLLYVRRSQESGQDVFCS